MNQSITGVEKDNIYEEAVRWFVRLRADDVSPVEWSNHNNWLAQSPDHLAAFQRVVKQWDEADILRDYALAHLDSLEQQTDADTDLRETTFSPAKPVYTLKIVRN